MLSPEQQQLFSQALGQLGPEAINTYSQFLQPMSQEDIQSSFQKSYVDPALQSFNQQFLPAIQERFMDSGASSALNQALAQGAKDLSTSLGSQYGGFMERQRAQQLGASQGFLPSLTQQTFTPNIQQQQGILGPLIGAAGQAGAGYLMSSEKVKENIRDYKKGLDILKNIDVKQYDYKEEYGGEKDRVGVIAEKMPKEITANLGRILNVDLYGLLGIAINAIKELNDKVEELEAK